MKLLVCVKQVPDLEARLRIAESGDALAIDEQTAYRPNEFDLHAVEAALRLRAARPGSSVELVTAGPQRCERALRRALGMGADRGAHIVTELEEHDPFRVAQCIAAFARPRAYDLVLTGVQSADAMQGLVGPTLAALLGRPCATGVIAAQWAEQGWIEVVRELEAGQAERLALALPALLTIQTGPEQPRYPTLSNMLAANRSRLEIVQAQSIELEAQRTRVQRLAYPQPTRECAMLEGTTQDKARQLHELLRRRNVL